jgi:N-acetylglucosaminyldiphosphoundecaprenol N-acetyl-beta-D-mannosaminyltransferase
MTINEIRSNHQMTTLIHSPERDCVSSLGIPVDNLTLDDTVDRVIAMAKMRDGRARLVSTLNVDFLVNSLGTRFTRARHPELLNVLRNSDLVTADGFPILWLSRIVGRPLQQRVCGSDLVPELAARASREGLSIFFLGGGEGVAQAAADTLVARHEDLRIAGATAPYIHTEGPGLAECVADDEAIVEKINTSGADILLVGLGNPKQELWFNRNRDKLKVPVSIGVGGTFEFITGSTRRAPEWVRRMNLEWIYRITQDPGRLWRRYTKGLFKLAALSAPLMYSRAAEMIAFAGRRPEAPDAIRWRTIWSSRDQALAVLRLPRLVTRDYLTVLVQSLLERRGANTLHLVDFSDVKKVEMAGHQALFSLAEIQHDEGGNLQLMAMPEALRRDLAASRVLDALSAGEGDALGALGGGANLRGGGFSCRSYVLEESALIFLGGRVSGSSLAQLAFVECLQHTARDRECIIDLRNATLLESSAIAALAPFLSGKVGDSGCVMFSGVSPDARQMFRMAGLGQPEYFINDSKLLRVIGGAGQGIA